MQCADRCSEPVAATISMVGECPGVDAIIWYTSPATPIDVFTSPRIRSQVSCNNISFRSFLARCAMCGFFKARSDFE